MSNLGQHLEKYTFEYLMSNALEKASDDIDKREGSIIYDALAPACMQLADMYMELKNVILDNFVTTAIDTSLDLKVAEQGLKRYEASKAIRLGVFTDDKGQPKDIPIGARFSTIDTTDLLNYIIIGPEEGRGRYKLQCESLGTKGNQYNGELLPITYVNGLAKATLLTVLTPGRDIEGDGELRNRFFDAVNDKAFGGNVAQYRQAIQGINGVGSVQVYPVWNGGGTVKCSVLDTEYKRATNEFIREVQNVMDPDSRGLGVGMAPIGHRVTITTPDEITINIDVSIDFLPSFTAEQLRDSITKAIGDYLLTLKKYWDQENEFNGYQMSVYRSQVSATILRIQGVANVASVKINSKDEDYVLQQNKLKQEIPLLGTVMINGKG